MQYKCYTKERLKLVEKLTEATKLIHHPKNASLRPYLTAFESEIKALVILPSIKDNYCSNLLV